MATVLLRNGAETNQEQEIAFDFTALVKVVLRVGGQRLNGHC